MTTYFEIDFNGVDYPAGSTAACAVAAALDYHQTLPAFEVTNEEHTLNLTNVEVVNAQAMVWNTASGVPLQAVKTLTFEPDAAVTEYLRTTVPAGRPTRFVSGLKGTIGANGFIVARDVAQANFVDQVSFMAVSYIATYTPLSVATNQPLTIDECGSFVNQLIFDCAQPGWFDPAAKVLGSEFIKPANLIPTIQALTVALGRVADDGSGPYTGPGDTKAEWWTKTDSWTPGKCEVDADCTTTNITAANDEFRGLYPKCDVRQAPARCVMCDGRNTAMCDVTTQIDVAKSRSAVGQCFRNDGQGMCNFFSGKLVDAPDNYDPPPPPSQTGCVPNCTDSHCFNGKCVECFADDHCVLLYQGTYSGSCDMSRNTCSYTLPAYQRGSPIVKDDSQKVVIIACASAGGVCCIGIIVAILFFRMRRARLNEADNTLSDTLSKKARNRSDRFTFTD